VRFGTSGVRKLNVVCTSSETCKPTGATQFRLRSICLVSLPDKCHGLGERLDGNVAHQSLLPMMLMGLLTIDLISAARPAAGLIIVLQLAS